MRTPMMLIAAGFLAATPAVAGETKESVKFRFHRSALATEEGVEKVYAAMRVRAESKCDPHGDRVRSAIEACADELVSQWVEAAGDDRLSALHAAAL
jgi:UrcA family protein